MVKHGAILIRVSTDAQKEHGTSLPQQRKVLLQLAKSFGYAVSKNHIYDDGGYSGSQLTHDERPGLSELIKAAERREFEIVFVQYIDRWGRTTIENLITREKLKKLGIVIHSYFEGRMENDPAGDLLFMFHSWKAEADNQQRKERSIRGRIAATRNGKHCMGNPPYGYRRDFKTKKLFVVGKLVGWVKKFYHWCAVDRLSLREICRRANQLRAPLPGRRRKHNVWHRSSLHHILTNRAYTGRVTFRRYDRNGNERPEEEWVELSIPPIISEELFARVQKSLNENKETALRNTKRTYLYGGVIYCGYCRHRLGSGFQPARHQGEGTRYYHGPSRKGEVTDGRCAHCPQVAESRLQPAWEAIKNVITEPEYLRAKVMEYHAADDTKVKERLSEMESRISTVAAQRKKLLAIYVKDRRMDEHEYLHLVDCIDKELERMQDEKRDIEQRLLNKQEQIRLSEQVTTSYQQIRARLVNASYETRRAVIRKIVNKVLVYEQEREAEIEFNLAPSTGQAWSPFEHSGSSGDEVVIRSGSSTESDRLSQGGRDSAREHSIASSRSGTTGHNSTNHPQGAFNFRPSLIIKVKIPSAREAAVKGRSRSFRINDRSSTPVQQNVAA
jgi:site-specific DNA recombinase